MSKPWSLSEGCAEAELPPRAPQSGLREARVRCGASGELTTESANSSAPALEGAAVETSDWAVQHVVFPGTREFTEAAEAAEPGRGATPGEALRHAGINAGAAGGFTPAPRPRPIPPPAPPATMAPPLATAPPLVDAQPSLPSLKRVLTCAR